MTKTATILMIAGDELDRNEFAAIVHDRRLPWDVRPAPTLAAARGLLAEFRIDAVIADYELLGGHSPELLDGIPNIPLILIASTAEQESALAALEHGVDDCLLKDPERRYLQALPFVVEKTLYRKAIREKERRLTRELRESEQRLRATFDNAALGIVDVAADDRITDANERICQMLDFPREQLIGKSIHELTFVEDREKSDLLNAQLHAGRRDRVEYEKRYLKRDGSPLWVRVAITAIRDERRRWLHSIGTVEDISERKKAQDTLQQLNASLAATVKQLRRAEQDLLVQNEALKDAHTLLQAETRRYQDLFEAAPDGYVVTDHDGSILVVNRAALGMLQISADFAPGIPLVSFVDQDQVSRFLEALGRLRQGQRLDALEIGLGPRSGGKFDAEISAAMERPPSDEGEPRVRWLIRNITDRKRAEAALREAKEDLEQRIQERTTELRAAFRYSRRLLEASLDPLVAISPEGKITDVNKATELVTGVERECLIGTDFSDYFTEAHKAEAGYRQVLAQGETRDYPLTVRHISGRTTDVLYNATVYRDEAGQVQGVFAAARDVTQRKRAEEALAESRERFTHAVTAAREGVWDWNMETNEVWYSPRYKEMLGYSEEEIEHHASAWLRLLHPDDKERCQSLVEAVMRGERDYEIEFRLRHKDGHYLDILSRGLPIRRESDGKIVRIIGTHLDLTERKRAEAELEKHRHHLEQLVRERTAQLEAAKAEAERANSAKDHFLAVLSHELRTPLTPILATASMLESEALDEDSRESLEMIRRNAELEARLIDDLLDVTRIARGKLELNRRPVQVGTILRRAIEVCQPDIEARRLHFGADIVAGPHVVNADAARLQQVFWNVLKNAIKFTPHDGCVGARCWRQDSSIMVEVTDSGIGIEPEALHRIFNAFEQADPTMMRKFGGLGLGLAISKAIVEMHGGTIAAFSKGKGHGASFTVQLPVDAAHRAERPQRTPAKAPEPTPVRRAAGLRILLVEDHGDTARIMARLLRANGHKVQTAGDVATALQHAETATFDLLISDLGLPDGSGIDLLNRLRSGGHNYPAIAMTGYGQEDDIARTRAAGFAAHVVKPIEFEQFTRAVAEATGGAARGAGALTDGL